MRPRPGSDEALRLVEPSLYEVVMGPQFSRLAPALQRFHKLRGVHLLAGEVSLDGPQNLFASVLSRLLGSPLKPEEGKLHFELDAAPHQELWTRYFPSTTMRSRMSLVNGEIVEKLGAAKLAFRLDEVEGALEMRLLRMSLLGVPCPRWLLPRLVARETGSVDRICFDIEARVAGVGLVTRYRGWLQVPNTGGNP